MEVSELSNFSNSCSAIAEMTNEQKEIKGKRESGPAQTQCKWEIPLKAGGQNGLAMPWSNHHQGISLLRLVIDWVQIY